MSFLVEWMGLPGAGKSTLAPECLRALRGGPIRWHNEEAAMIRCLRRRDLGRVLNLLKGLAPPRVWRAAAERWSSAEALHQWASGYPRFFHQLFGRLGQIEPADPNRASVLFAFFQRTIRRALWERHAAADEGMVIEEGLCYSAFALLEGWIGDESVSDAVRDYAAVCPPPTALIWTDAPTADCAARLARRPALPVFWSGLEAGALRRRLESGRRILTATADAFAARGVPVYRVTTGDREWEDSIRLVRAAAADIQRKTSETVAARAGLF